LVLNYEISPIQLDIGSGDGCRLLPSPNHRHQSIQFNDFQFGVSDSSQTNTLASLDDGYPITADDKQFLASVVDAVGRKDFAWIANHTIYSVSITSSNGTQLVESSEEFRKILSQDLTDSIRAKILDAAKQPLFKNWQGVMIGEGSGKGDAQSFGETKELKIRNVIFPIARPAIRDTWLPL
jgi:hypothetical protein